MPEIEIPRPKDQADRIDDYQVHIGPSLQAKDVAGDEHHQGDPGHKA